MLKFIREHLVLRWVLPILLAVYLPGISFYTHYCYESAQLDVSISGEKACCQAKPIEKKIDCCQKTAPKSETHLACKQEKDKDLSQNSIHKDCSCCETNVLALNLEEEVTRVSTTEIPVPVWNFSTTLFLFHYFSTLQTVEKGFNSYFPAPPPPLIYGYRFLVSVGCLLI